MTRMLRSDMNITPLLALLPANSIWDEPPPNICSQGYLQRDACGLRARRCLRLSHTRFHPRDQLSGGHTLVTARAFRLGSEPFRGVRPRATPTLSCTANCDGRLRIERAALRA